MAKIGGHGKPLSLIIWFRVSHKLAKGQGMHGNTLFDQSKEKHAPMRGLAPVEPEREFVEIGLQVIFFESALMRPHQPSFNQRGNTVYARQNLVGLLAGTFDRRSLVDVFVFGGTGVGYEPVGVDRRTRLDVLLDKRLECFGFCVWNNLQAAAPEALGGKQFNGDCHQYLAFGTASAFSVPYATKDCLINFDVSGQHIVPCMADCRPEPVQHRPSGLVGTEPENAMQRFGGNAIFSRGQMPCSGKPDSKRRSSTMENRARRAGNTIAARIAPPFAILHAPALDPVARWARKTVFPSKPVKVVKASRVIRKPCQKLGIVARVIDTSSGGPWYHCITLTLP